MACRGLVAILLSLGAVAVMGELTPLKVHVLVPYDNPVYSTESTLPAMELAVDDINNSSAYLNGYNLSLIVTNTEVATTYLVCSVLILISLSLLSSLYLHPILLSFFSHSLFFFPTLLPSAIHLRVLGS